MGQLVSFWLQIKILAGHFVQVMHPQVTTLTDGNIFFTWDTKSMTSGQITNAVQSVFKKAGIEQRVTSTSFRKAAVTKVHMDCQS
jgi:site-specific recombinase XerD